MDSVKDREPVVVKDSYDLNQLTKNELILSMYQLLDMLPEKDRLDFVSKWINPKAALSEAGACDTQRFMSEVFDFCDACRNGEYFIDSDDYDDFDEYDRHSYYDWYEPYHFKGSPWASKFDSLFRLAIIHGRNKDYKTAFSSLEALLDCIQCANEDFTILGTQNPMTFIDINWVEVFHVYLISMSYVFTVPSDFARMLVKTWCGFKEYVYSDLTHYLDNHFDEIEEAICYYVEMFQNHWGKQLELYELLEKLYEEAQKTFPKKSIARRFASYNANFYVGVISELCVEEHWMEAYHTIEKALDLVVDKEMKDELRRQKIDCLEALGNTSEAYELAFEMMISNPDYGTYQMLRRIAIAKNYLNEMILNVTTEIKTAPKHSTTLMLLQIFSVEGHIDQLVHTALATKYYDRHECLKYAAKSLIYRALSTEINFLSLDLQEYLKRIADQQILGIVDMGKKTYSTLEKANYLDHAMEILKQIIQLHIDEAKRTRYARAAYYCALTRDICFRLHKEEDFQQYFQTLFAKYSNKPALKDEMIKKLGRPVK